MTVAYLKGEEDAKKPAAGDSSGLEDEMLKLFAALDEAHREQAMDYLRYLAGKDRQRE